jgi:hypothetical protein
MNIVTVARVERNPTVKNEIAQKGFARSLPVGFLACRQIVVSLGSMPTAR